MPMQTCPEFMVRPIVQLRIECLVSKRHDRGRATSKRNISDSQVHSILDVRIIEDNCRRLATELEGATLHVALEGHFLDLLSGCNGSGEADLSDLHVLRKKGPSSTASRDELDYARREAGFLDKLSHGSKAERALFGTLEHDL